MRWWGVGRRVRKLRKCDGMGVWDGVEAWGMRWFVKIGI